MIYEFVQSVKAYFHFKGPSNEQSLCFALGPLDDFLIYESKYNWNLPQFNVLFMFKYLDVLDAYSCLNCVHIYFSA